MSLGLQRWHQWRDTDLDGDCLHRYSWRCCLPLVYSSGGFVRL